MAATITCPLDNIKTKLQTQSEICEVNEKVYKTNNNTKTDFKKMDSLKVAQFTKVEFQACKNIVEPPRRIKYTNIFSTINQIYNENGFFKGFYKGLTARILCVAPSVAISWGSYEFIKAALTKVMK